MSSFLRLKATVAIADEKQELELLHLSPTDEPTEELDAMVQRTLPDVRLEQEIKFYETQANYRYENLPQKPLEWVDTFIQLNLPYCLHIPNDLVLEVGDGQERSLVKHQKIWTRNSTDCSNADFLADDQITYFGNWMADLAEPPAPEIGPYPPVRGTNVEKLNDRSGYFRYTTLQIWMRTGFDAERAQNQAYVMLQKRLAEERVKGLVYKIIDVYRFVTQEEHVDRKTPFLLTELYFADANIGFTYIPMNVEAAMMNRSKRELDQMSQMLRDGQSPAVHELLFLDARSSSNTGLYSLAIVEGFQALELFLESFLADRYKNQGLSDSDIEKKLAQRWRLSGVKLFSRWATTIIPVG